MRNQNPVGTEVVHWILSGLEELLRVLMAIRHGRLSMSVWDILLETIF